MNKVENPTNLTAWNKNLLQLQKFIQKVDFPENMPGSCRVCGSANKGEYLDTGHLEEFYGSVYYCHECFNEMATIMGYIKPDTMTMLEDFIAELQADNQALRLTIEGYGKVFDGVATINSSPVSDSPVHPVHVSDQSDSERPQRTEENVGDGTRKVVRSKHDQDMGIFRSTPSE